MCKTDGQFDRFLYFNTRIAICANAVLAVLETTVFPPFNNIHYGFLKDYFLSSKRPSEPFKTTGLLSGVWHADLRVLWRLTGLCIKKSLIESDYCVNLSFIGVIEHVDGGYIINKNKILGQIFFSAVSKCNHLKNMWLQKPNDTIYSFTLGVSKEFNNITTMKTLYMSLVRNHTVHNTTIGCPILTIFIHI